MYKSSSPKSLKLVTSSPTIHIMKEKINLSIEKNAKQNQHKLERHDVLIVYHIRHMHTHTYTNTDTYCIRLHRHSHWGMCFLLCSSLGWHWFGSPEFFIVVVVFHLIFFFFLLFSLLVFSFVCFGNLDLVLKWNHNFPNWGNKLLLALLVCDYMCVCFWGKSLKGNFVYIYTHNFKGEKCIQICSSHSFVLLMLINELLLETVSIRFLNSARRLLSFREIDRTTKLIETMIIKLMMVMLRWWQRRHIINWCFQQTRGW
jgi:hypothetical protein